MSEFINAHYDKIYKYCYFKIKNQYVAEDLTQETFLKFFNQNTYIDNGKSLAYLYTIAKNLCIDYMRKKKSISLNDELVYKDEFEQIDIKASIKYAISTLTDQQQEIILLKYANDLKISDIAMVTGLSRFAVNRKLKTAHEQLKLILREEDFC